MADTVAAAVAALIADVSVSALVGPRVFGGELPAREAKDMPRATILVSPAGGGFMGTGTASYGDQRLDLDCYGETPHEAWSVYQAAYTALKGLRRGTYAGVVLHWAKPVSRGTLARDPDTDWPITLSSWQVLASEA